MLPNARWLENYNEIKNFSKKPSTCSKDPKERKLGSWCARQYAIKRGTIINKFTNMITPEKEQLLEQIPWWEWEKQNSIHWLENYNKIKDLPKKPSRIKGSEEDTLARWCQTQCQANKGHNNLKISIERMKLLEKIPWWKWKVNRDENWQSYYDKIRTLAKKPKEQPLNTWCNRQRIRQNHHALTSTQMWLLEKILWWPKERNQLWMDTYDLIKVLKKPKSKKSQNWCYFQRHLKKIGVLSNEKISLLEQIPEWKWEMRKKYAPRVTKPWMENYNIIKNLPKKPSVYSKDLEKKRLANWCANQKQAKKHKNITPERAKLLEQISWWKWQYDQQS